MADLGAVAWDLSEYFIDELAGPADFSGDLKVAGTGTAIQGEVLAIDPATGRVAGRTISDPSTGAFSIPDRAAAPMIVLGRALDGTRNIEQDYDGVIGV